MAEAVADKVEKVKAEKPDKGSQASKLMSTMTETDGNVTVGGPMLEEVVTDDKPVIDEHVIDKASVVKDAPVEDKDKKPLPGEEEDALGEEKVETHEAIEVPEELKTAPIKDQLQWKHAKYLEKKTRELELENARLKGRAEATPAHVVSERDVQVTEQPPVAVTNEALKAKLKVLDDSYESGKFEGSFVDYMTERGALVAEHRSATSVKTDIVSAQRTARANALTQAMDKRAPTLPGLKEAFESLRTDKVAGNDPILLSAIENHLADGGMDVMHYLGHHPAYRAQVMALPADEKGAELVRLRLALTRPRKTDIKPIIKPSTPIQNSQVVETNTNDSDDAGVMEEINKARGRR